MQEHIFVEKRQQSIQQL
jgi:hypothetical protein